MITQPNLLHKLRHKHICFRGTVKVQKKLGLDLYQDPYPGNTNFSCELRNCHSIMNLCQLFKNVKRVSSPKNNELLDCFFLLKIASIFNTNGTLKSKLYSKCRPSGIILFLSPAMAIVSKYISASPAALYIPKVLP